MFEPQHAAQHYDDNGDDAVDRSSQTSANSSIQQSQLDAFQQLQQRGTETIQFFTATPSTTRGRGTRQQVTPSAAAAAATATTGAPPVAGDNEVVALDEIYAIEYNRDMERKWADEESDESIDIDQEDGGNLDDDDDNFVEEFEEEAEETRRDLFGSQEQEEDDIDEEQRDQSNDRRRRRRQSQQDDDNPRPNKRRRDTSTPPTRRGGGGTYDTRHREECFLCAWGNKFHDGIEAPHVNKLHDIIAQNYGVHANREIANELHLYFKREIYDPSLGMSMLTRQCALEHIEQLHTLDARIFLGESIRAEKQLAFLFKNKIWRRDGSFDKWAAEQYRKSMKVLCQLYRMPLASMNFNNGNNAEDLKRAANYMNLMMPRFDQRKPEPRRTATTTGDRRTTSGSGSVSGVAASRKRYVG